MANIGTFIIPAGNWVKLEDIIKEKVAGFAFSAGTTYLMQVQGANMCSFISSLDTPLESDSGFQANLQEKFTYTQVSGETLYVKANSAYTVISVAQ